MANLSQEESRKNRKNSQEVTSRWLVVEESISEVMTATKDARYFPSMESAGKMAWFVRD